MYNKDDVKKYVNRPDIDRLSAALISLCADGGAKKISEIRQNLIDSGRRDATKWNISLLFGRSKGAAINTSSGWEITDVGLDKLMELGVPVRSEKHVEIARNLRAVVENKLKAGATRDFALEAVQCFEASFYRAAVVLSWMGAIGLVYEYVLKEKLEEFNSEARRRDKKWKDAKSFDDLSKMKEYDFLQVCSAISVFGKSIKDELEQRLKFRNGCGHPNNLKISEGSVSYHIEILILNIYSVFGYE